MGKLYSFYYSLYTLLLVCCLLLVACLAHAGELGIIEVTPFNSFVTNTLQPLILSLLGTVVTVAVAYFSGILKKKFGLELSEKITTRLRGIAWDAVNLAEEKAALYLKTAGEKMLSTTKYAGAYNYVFDKVPTISPEEADALIHAALAKVKGLGATAELGQ